MAPKIKVKDRLTGDGEIDLSMSDLEDVPVKEIMQLKKAYSLDLSNNILVVLPKTFPTLTHIIKLDLSKNELKELPEDFGNLIRLKHLDLYSNQLQHLPLSFSKLTDLRWLDLKENPLVPTVAKVAGPCFDAKQCQTCARDIVKFFGKLEEQIKSDLEERSRVRRKQLEINEQKKKEEKKVKKKEKQKMRQENLQKNEKSEQSKKDNDNKKMDKPVTHKEQTTKGSNVKKFFITFVLLTLGLFLSTSIPLKYTERITWFIKQLFDFILDKVPDDYKFYAIRFGEVFHDIHQKTGSLTMLIIDNTKQRVAAIQWEQFYESFRDFLHNCTEKVKTVFNVVSKDV